LNPFIFFVSKDNLMPVVAVPTGQNINPIGKGGEGMKQKGRRIVLTSLCAVLMVGAAISVQASDLLGPREQMTNSGIMYMTGGVGIESRAMMEMAYDKYNLKVVVASSSGAYLADAMITIKDAAGKQVLKTMTDGPWLLVKLPKGSYRVTASLEGRQKTERVSVSTRLKTIMLHWKP
jgi:hypothetical protein